MLDEHPWEAERGKKKTDGTMNVNDKCETMILC